MKAKVILITGASSGIGFETALRLAKQGHHVYGAARRVERMQDLAKEGVTVIPMDVTDPKSIQEGVAALMTKEQRIDVLINNAGYGSFGAVEDVSIEEARRQLEVNVFGLAQLTQAVLPAMREQKSGLIINLSSVAGKMPFSFGTWYNVSKYAVEAFSDALRMEVAPFGIRVVKIEPGPIATAWGPIAADHLEESAKGKAYEQQAMNAAKGLRNLYSARWLTKPTTVSRLLTNIVNSRCPRRRYVVGLGARSMLLFHALLPAAWYEFFATKMMSKL